MGGLPDHVKGLLITGIGALLLSPDSLLVRVIAIDQWSMIFWRGVLVAFCLGTFLVLKHGRETAARCREIGKTGLLLAVVLASSSVLFIVALAHTSVANTLIIVSAAPLFAALISRSFLSEAVAPRTWAAILGAICGIAVIVSDSPGGSNLGGDLAALATALCIAASLALLRRTRARGAIPAVVLSGLLSAIVSLPLAAPFALGAGQAGLMALLGLVVLPVAFCLTMLGPRYLPAPEVGLILLLETVLGPLWVWLALGEDPGTRALIGGTIVVAALAAHSALALRGEPVSG
jgi:drug/metabolite transporter (DMT)-like permease